MASEKIVINSSGVELAYSDSGAVPGSSSYTTIIAIHGLGFSGSVFKKLQAAAPAKNARVIALNRRNYPGSTPFTAEELSVVTTGTPEQREEWMKNHGHEIAYFIDAVIQKKDLPPISADGKSGGGVLMGWSIGAAEVTATIAHADTLPEATRSRVTSFIRSAIFYEPPPIILGLPMPAKNWLPISDESIPMELRLPFFGQWLSSYFDHSDLSKRDPALLQYVLPSTLRAPSIYNMAPAEQLGMVCLGPAALDGPYMFTFGAQFNAAYRKTLLEAGKLFPKLKIWHLAGERGVAFGVAGLWTVQDEAEKEGAKIINFKVAPGANHFIHWDDPELALDLFLA